MKVSILIDNRPSDNPVLVSEHGFSALATTNENRRILVDTGLSGRAFDNASALGIDMQNIDYLILSHGHKDHTGGLERFVTINKNAKIIAHSAIQNFDYQSNRGGKWHSLSPDQDIIRKNFDRFIFIDDNYPIDNNIIIIKNKTTIHPRPLGNRYLYLISNSEVLPYPASDEISLCINHDGRLTIISPCSHNGLLNIADECCNIMKTNNMAAFIGGLHLLDGEGDNIEKLSSTIIKKYPQMRLYTGHCTGNEACNMLANGLGAHFNVFKTGDTINI